ncbi:Ras guanine-nucleotide exchange factors catalytic domain,SH2 domain [Cinara cedri]|uniref:Ras guanine-nucleotide exchange factors catalytic domain,SH2 domain n=1 Tax=Cinara cedri TaxID=506608 RepID=A0A5E4MBN5_9HEMI|nr:Ras guanine-nucleotide exchange factors catalytic domain,SH2 domain [Cinara cedri]
MTSNVQSHPANNGNHQRQQNMQQQQEVVVGSSYNDLEQKKLLEWELSSLGADDLRSHAWYHGHRVDRAEAERLLRQCVAVEHGFSIASLGSNIIGRGSVASLGAEKDNAQDSDSDGLEDANSVSSDSDFTTDDFLDGLVKDLVPFPSTTMDDSLLLQQRRRLDSVLPPTSARRPRQNRRYFYCFLVRDSLNVRPPGRYVVSCLRVDKYDNEDNKNNSVRNTENEQRMQFLRHQQRRRRRKQQRHPVLHFVINEIILQPGTVYERSQFTFGDALPTVALMTSAASTMISSNNGELNGQRKYQPGFDSVPDLIRYYVGGSDDNAVLSYGGGHEGTTSSSSSSNTMFPQPLHTEVRIRYPCNRRYPLITFHTLDETTTPSFISKPNEHSHVPDKALALTELQQLPLSVPIAPGVAETTSSLKLLYHQSPSPPLLHISPRKHMSSLSFRSSLRRTPTATATPSTFFRPSSAAESVTSGLPLNISLQSSSTSSPSLLRAYSQASTLGLSVSSCSSIVTTNSTMIPFITPHTSNFRSLSSSLPNHDLCPLVTIPFTNKHTILPEPVSQESSTLKNLKISGTSLETTESPGTLFESNSSIPEINEEVCGVLNVIDVDAEKATTLPVGNTDSSYHNGVFHLPNWPIIQSSFARANLNNRYQSRNKRFKIRSCSDQSRSRSYHCKPECNRNKHENHCIVRYSGNREKPNNNDNIKVREYGQRPQFQQQESSLPGHPLSMLGVNVPKHIQQHKVMEYLKSTKCHSCYDSFIVSVDYSGNKESESGNENNDHNDRQDLQPQKNSLTDSSLTSLSMVTAKNSEEGKRLVMDTEEPLMCIDLNQQNTEKNMADLKTKLLTHREQIDPVSEPRAENKLLTPIQYDDFDEWRSLWALLLRQRVVSKQEKRLQDHRLHNEQLKILNIEFEELHQQLLGEFQEINSKVTFSNNVGPLSSLHDIVPSRTSEISTSGTVQHSIPIFEEKCTSNLDGTSTEIRDEDIILQWLGILQDIDTDDNFFPLMINRKINQKPEINIIKQQKQQLGRQLIVPCNHQSQSQNGEHLSNLTTMKHPAIESTSKSPILPEIVSCAKPTNIGCHLVCDYENISGLKDNDCLDNLENSKYFKTIGPLNDNHSSTNSKCCIEYNTTVDIDYENIVEDIDYQNIGIVNRNLYQEKRRKQMKDGRGGSTAVVNALRAVHLTIVGNPDNNGGIISAGTGRLAAALCRADGSATILPYRRYQSKCGVGEEKPVESIISACPLQLLSQPGLAGRRARLDIIERFACLQYLVAMTVIVTPCLILIGNDNSGLKNQAVECEWNLEDEYEYRRRQFYYRCSGAAGWYFSGKNSVSEDDDDFELPADCDLDFDYSLPQRGEWIAERRHWLDQLARHRATALDKWIRTAADVKQAVGDVFGYRALMSALCSDRIQALQDAWASLRQLHTTTAVEFESRLRPEFLGRREKYTSTGVGEATRDIIGDDENNVDALLQLPPNATIPDATALAVLYEHMYNDHTCGSITMTSSANDNVIKEEKNYRPSSLFTSPLSLSPSPWFSLSSGISGGLGALAASDYGIHALHALCVQYSEWVQQSFDINESEMPSARPLVLQLDRFRSNFRALVLQYSDDEDNHDYSYDNKYDYEDVYVYGYNQEACPEKPCDQDNGFAYERNYEDKVEEYGCGDGNYENYCDNDDDDATVICCSNSSSIEAISSVETSNASNTGTASTLRTRVGSGSNKTSKDDYTHHKEILEDDRYCHWIKNIGNCNQSTAPLSTVFHTELHVRLFWPPTLLLLDDNDDINNVNDQPVVPAYMLGTTYAAKAATLKSCRGNEETHCSKETRLSQTFDSLIVAQLDRAAQDMRLRYKIMDNFLDGACAYSTFAVKAANAEDMVTGNQQHNPNYENTSC